MSNRVHDFKSEQDLAAGEASERSTQSALPASGQVSGTLQRDVSVKSNPNLQDSKNQLVVKSEREYTRIELQLKKLAEQARR